MISKTIGFRDTLFSDTPNSWSIWHPAKICKVDRNLMKSCKHCRATTGYCIWLEVDIGALSSRFMSAKLANPVRRQAGTPPLRRQKIAQRHRPMPMPMRPFLRGLTSIWLQVVWGSHVFTEKVFVSSYFALMNCVDLCSPSVRPDQPAEMNKPWEWRARTRYMNSSKYHILSGGGERLKKGPSKGCLKKNCRFCRHHVIS